jgi:fructuronate reductase
MMSIVRDEVVRLGVATVDRLPSAVRRPAYARTEVGLGILHLGVGAFHRCHQAEWTDDALAERLEDWGIVGVNLRAPDIQATIGDQDGYYCRITRDAGPDDVRLIGAIQKTISVRDPVDDPQRLTLSRALEQAAAPEIRIISLTVTEKGYCHIPATGELDLANADIVHDRGDPARPLSVPGFVLRAIAMRREGGIAPPVLISCDNVPDNGTTLRGCVLSLAHLIDPDLAAFIEDEVTFLNTMVDRIVPATLDEDIEHFAECVGVRDHGLVVGEPFRMWVIEKPAEVLLPAWDRAGALFVPDVLPYEILKMRVLNGIQSNVCQLGALSDLDYMADVMALPEFREFAEGVIRHEVLPCLGDVPGIDLDAYVTQSIERLTNPKLKHRTTQISTDGSQKIKQRLLQPLRDAVRAGVEHDGLLLGVAGWMQYATGLDHRGNSFPVADPVAGKTRTIALDAEGDPQKIVEGMLELEGVFGTDIKAMPDVVDRLVEFLTALMGRSAREVVADFVARRRSDRDRVDHDPGGLQRVRP